MIALIRNLTHIFTTDVFKNYNLVDQDVQYMFAACCVIMPFLKEDKVTVEDAIKVSKRLMLDYFFSQTSNNVTEERLTQLVTLAAVCISCGQCLAKELRLSNLSVMKKLFELKDIKTLTKCNVFNKIEWYNKELLQELIIITALSLKIYSEDEFTPEEFIDELFSKELLSEYKLENFLTEEELCE